jgi:hypothetical protein
MKVMPGIQPPNVDAPAQSTTGGGAPAATTDAPPLHFSADDMTKVLSGAAQLGSNLLAGFLGTAGIMASAPTGPKPYAGPPILGKFQQERFKDHFYNDYSQGEREVMMDLLSRTGSQEEMDYLMKAVASGHKFSTVAVFADQIRGKSPDWLHKNLRITGDADNAPGLSQQWSCSCGPTTAEVVRAEMDPIYALTLNRRNKDLHANDPRPGVDDGGKTVGNHEVGQEQKDELEKNGGKAVRRGEKGGEYSNIEGALTDIQRWTGVEYETHGIESVDRRMKMPAGYQAEYDKNAEQNLRDSFKKLDADLADGIPCAMRVTDSKNSGGHYVAITGVFGSGADKTYVIHDPWDGKTVYVKASDMEKGKVSPKIASWDEISTLYTSKR